MSWIWIIVFIAVVLLGLAARLFGRPPENPPPGATDEDIRRLALAGRKIDAIRWHRILHGTELREAKAAVEAMTGDRA